jgi:hypothetical protein
MSNSEHPLKIDASDRRFHFYSSPAAPQPPQFYGEFYQWLDTPESLAAVVDYLHQYDLTGFNPF